MSKEARLAAARERVKRWKADKLAHGYSLKQQWLRRYERQKAKRLDGLKAKVRSAAPAPKVQYAHYGETERGLIEGVDRVEERLQTGWSDGQARCERMEPNKKGGHGRVEASMGQRDEPRVTGADVSGPIQETPNETKAYADLERFKAKRALKERRGVTVEIVL